MKTGALIDELIRTAGVSPKPQLVRAAASIAGLAVLSVLALVGPRPDLLDATRAMTLPAKLLFTAAVAGVSLRFLPFLGTPGRELSPRRTWGSLLLLSACPASALGYAIAAEQLTRLFRPEALRCVSLLAALTALTLPLMIRACRAHAPTRLRSYGAHTGVASAALAATAYVLTCRQDDPLFVLFWYGIFMLVVGLLGSQLLPRALRW